SSVTKTADLADVLAVDLDETFKQPETVSRDSKGTRYTGPDASTPDNNPYMPTRDTGSIAFKVAHPTWDGRGVTVGILDSGVDLDHPALKTTSTGAKKIVDWFTETDPVSEGSLVAGGDATWLPMLQAASGPTFPTTGTYRGAQWTLPAGSYKIRTLDEANTNLSGCELCGDVNRDGDTTDRIGVLYDPATSRVWVDTDDDKDFTDETAMTRYRDSQQVGHIGKDNKGTDVQESVPYVVDVRKDQDILGVFGPGTGLPDKADFVDIGISSGEHGSHVAGIVAANDMFGGAMDGQAPGAKLVSARACSFGSGCTAAALSDGMAELAANRGVDIINMSIGGLPALNDGDNARADLYNSIINKLGVQLVISAGNSSAALNTVGDPSVATDVVSVGADITKETWQANYGSTVGFSENIMPFSSGGPREDGGFKPNITAPGAAIATTPLWLPGAPVAEAGYDLRAGYSMLQGTSMASPQAAGSMTLLLSAAKQSGVKKTSPAALRTAVYSSAQWNSAIPAFLQGHGQIDVPGAWNLFKQNLDAATIETSAPVCTEIWKILGRDTGTGLYNRCAADAGGQAPGSTKGYNVTLTRTTGPAKSGTYNLTLLGNDGTFALSQRSVSLPKGTPVTIKVTASPTAGAHSAVLNIDDPSSAGLDGSMMAVVAAGEAFPSSFTVTKSGVAKRNEAQRYYVTVPAGVKALEIGMSGRAAGSQTRFLAFQPYGLPMDNTSTPNCYSNYGTPEGNGCDSNTRAYANPQPGVWEILVESRRTSPLLDNPFTLTAKLLGATVDPAMVTLDSVVKGAATPVQWTVTNKFADVTAKAVGGPLGSALSDRPTISATDPDKVYTVDVPSGSSRLDVSIGNTSDPNADLDLFVTGPSGAKQSADGDSEESVSYTDPKPGTYTVRIDNYAVPSGSTAFDYQDVFFSSALGEVAVDSTPFAFPGGASKTIAGTVTAKEAAAAGRSLFGNMTVVSNSGAVLGKGDVLIKAVSG
ncbi:MAG: S8 family serine peptidase, partial [Actinomycetes bacterium]